MIQYIINIFTQFINYICNCWNNNYVEINEVEIKNKNNDILLLFNNLLSNLITIDNNNIDIIRNIDELINLLHNEAKVI